jgi:hypothetical protein
MLIVNTYASSNKSISIDPIYISIPEGLASANVQSVLQDRYGLLWIGTETGLHQYDGYTFTRYKNIPGVTSSLLADNIWGLEEDKKGNLWVAHENGVSRFNRTNNEFTNYDFQENFKITSANGGRVFNLLIDSNDRIWAASLNFNVLLYDSLSDSWRQIKILTNDTNKVTETRGLVLGISEDNNGNIWIGSDFGLNYFSEKDTAFIPQNIENGYQIDFSSSENKITELH